MQTDYTGIDYGRGMSNVNNKTGIHYGVINQHDVGQAWYDDSEPYYGEPCCPYCGEEAIDAGNLTEEQEEKFEYDETAYEYACLSCQKIFSAGDAMGEPISFSYKDNEYSAKCWGESGDIFILKSPYYTFAQFCSPCAPGAVYLMNPLKDKIERNKGYCFGHDWFESGKAPYPVYDVKTDKLVKPN